MRKSFRIGLVLLLVLTTVVGCGKAGKTISVVTREEGSGTRGAFIELFGVEEKDANGNKTDKTTTDANTIQSTAVMMSTVAGDENAIGYCSLGSLNDTVKALKVDGVEAKDENIKSGTYKISRPFNIVTKSTLSDVAKDFVNYILSADGQKVVSDSGYISLEAKAYTGTSPSGKIVVAGSSSVSPVMEKLIESYKKVNANAQIDLQTSDSTTGITSAIQGSCDIGMASRELKDAEKSQGIESTVIAMDGIAVIVNKSSTLTDISKDNVKKIYTGELKEWDEVK